MTLKEAIEHCYEVADKKVIECDACKQDHIQLAKWLEELEFRRSIEDIILSNQYDKVTLDGRTLEAGQQYKHFKKGNLYNVVIPCVFDTDDCKEYVIYRGNDNKRRLWARPMEEFLSVVDRNKYPEATQLYRFELVEEQ